jgi:uroporphyrinogen-III synthase
MVARSTQSPDNKPRPDFQGMRVLALESRRAAELAALVTSYGGRPIVAPALREAPRDSRAEALAFAVALVQHELDLVIFLTGVGARALVSAAQPSYSRDVIVAALQRTKIVVRGPKPLAVLRELHVPVWAAAPEPNTWREVLAAIDERSGEWSPQGARVAVQEYGRSNAELLDGLRARGAQVMAVPVYEWALPDDLDPLRDAAAAIARGEIDVVVFTTGVQVDHLWQIVRQLGREADVRGGLARAVVASIGPSTSAALKAHGLAVDWEASRPRMGQLLRELAEQSAVLLRAKKN